MTTNATATEKTDKYGFPIRPCSRCLGSGRYSYNQVHGDMCYGCSGTGWQHTPKAAKAFTAWQDAIRAVARVWAQNLVVGMEVRSWDSRGEWETVESVVVTDEPSGWKNLPNGEREIFSYVTILNGRKQNGATLYRVKGAAASIDRAPFLKMAGVR